MRIAVYAGTFDPVTRGHESVIARAAVLFDQLIVVVAVNPTKTPLFTPAERIGMLAEVTTAWPQVRCQTTSGYVVHLARQHGARYLVRGVRSATDVEQEIVLATANHDLAPEIETVFVPAHRGLSEVSSTRLKELAQLGDDLSAYCSASVAARLRQLWPQPGDISKGELR